MNPSDHLPPVTNDRLSRIADILSRSRDSAARHAKRKLGDSLCSIGLVAYDRSCAALGHASVDEYRDWLSTAFEDNHFVIKICGIPMRFYRGDPDLPVPAKTLKIGIKELVQTELALESNGLAAGVKCFRLEVEKDDKGFTKAVNFVMVDHDGGRYMTWPIPRFVAQQKAKRIKKGAVQLKPISLDEPTAEPRNDELTA